MRDPSDSFFNPAFRHQRRPPLHLPLPDEKMLTEILGRLAAGSDPYPLQIVFYEKLLDRGLLLPVPSDAPLHRGLPLLLLENDRGERGIPVFTSEGSFERWADDTINYVLLPFSALCGYALEARADYLVLNVAGPYGCEIGASDFSYLAEGLLPPPPSEEVAPVEEMMVDARTPIRLRASQGLPDSLMLQLAHVFNTHLDLIERVYLFDIAFNDEPLEPALGIRMPGGLEAEWEGYLWPTLQAILNEMLDRTRMSVFLLNHSGSLEQHILEVSCPIFGSPHATECRNNAK